MSAPRVAVVYNPVKVGDVERFRHDVLAGLDKSHRDDVRWSETTPDETGATPPAS